MAPRPERAPDPRTPAGGLRARLLDEARAGSQAAEERLVASLLGLVEREARARAGRGLSEGDLVQEGSVGLVLAIREFEGPGDAGFDRYVSERVGRQMDAALADEEASAREARLLVEAAKAYEAAQLSVRRDLGRDPTDGELAQKLEWSVERVTQIALVVDEARHRHDLELLPYLDPELIDFDALRDAVEGEAEGD